MSRLLDVVREMVVELARLEMTQAPTSELDHVPPPPPPPLPMQFHTFPQYHRHLEWAWQWESCSRGKWVVGKQRQIDPTSLLLVRATSSQCPQHHSKERKDIFHFPKNGGHLFYDLEVALEWIDNKPWGVDEHGEST